MNKFLIGASAVLALMLSSMTPAMAADSVANQTAQTQAVSTTSQANGGTLLFAPVSDSTNTVQYSASSAIAPSLTSSNDTCMGSSSAGGSGYSFGFSVGTTWTDQNCKMLKNSRELWNQGKLVAAMALMCADDDIRYALSVSGGVLYHREDGATVRMGCPMSKSEWVAKGRPLLDPTTGAVVTPGSVVHVAAPSKPKLPLEPPLK